MKALFWTVMLFALAVGLVVAARYNDGYVLAVLPPYRVEVSLNLLFVLLAAGFVVLYSVIRLVTTAVLLPARVRDFRLARRRDHGRAALLEALEAFFEGRYAKAEQAATRAMSLGEPSRVALVLAARAAHGLRAYERREAYLREAQRDAPDDDALLIVSEAELLLDERRAKEALETLQRLPRKHTAALRLELKARQQTRQWEQVAALLGELERRGVLDEQQATKLRTHAFAESLRRTGADSRALDEAWRKIADAQKREAPIAAAAAQAYLAAGRRDAARQIIEQSLAVSWDSELVALYAESTGTDAVRQIERAETWLEDHPHDGALLLTLGRLCARQSLWGKAESYLEAALSVEPTYTAHLELARLHERLGNTEAARRHYSASLDLALGALGQNALRGSRAGVDPLEVEQRR